VKILHSEASCGWGGQEIRILSEAQGMRLRGHDVRLICPAEARIFSEAPRFGVPVEALDIGRKSVSGLRAMRRFLATPAAASFDVINTHSSTDTWLAALALMGKRNAPALVRTRHVSAPVANNLTTRWLYRTASARVVTTGEALRQTLINDNSLDPSRVISVPTGIDVTRYSPATAAQRSASRAMLSVDADTFVIGIVATLRSWKGHRYLIEAIGDLHRAAHAPIRLVIVGDGPQQQALKTQVEALGLQQLVDMRGNQNDVIAYLHGFDCFALPSYANEGVPQAILQAMGCAVPVVTTDAGAIGEVAQHQRTALVVPRQDSAALAAALSDVMQHKDQAARRALQARADIEAGHSLAFMLDRMEQVFVSASAARQANQEI
jgi:glycosyltransferase involved in cell wall biosynthesis